VPLSPAVVTMLKKYRAAQAADKVHAGNQWVENGLVFATDFGTPVDPRNALRAVELAAEKAGIENVGVHTLRHSAAVAWLEAGVHIKRSPTYWDTARSASPGISTATRRRPRQGPR
jgi:integrase